MGACADKDRGSESEVKSFEFKEQKLLAKQTKIIMPPSIMSESMITVDLDDVEQIPPHRKHNVIKSIDSMVVSMQIDSEMTQEDDINKYFGLIPESIMNNSPHN